MSCCLLSYRLLQQPSASAGIPCPDHDRMSELAKAGAQHMCSRLCCTSRSPPGHTCTGPSWGVPQVRPPVQRRFPPAEGRPPTARRCAACPNCLLWARGGITWLRDAFAGRLQAVMCLTDDDVFGVLPETSTPRLATRTSRCAHCTFTRGPGRAAVAVMVAAAERIRAGVDDVRHATDPPGVGCMCCPCLKFPGLGRGGPLTTCQSRASTDD
jgi:hypothetical protein